MPEVSAAPMRAPARPTVTLTFVGPADSGPVDRADKLTVEALKQGSFAIGTWGPAQDLDDKTVPAGDVLSAVDRLLVSTTVVMPDGTGAIEYRQVEVDPYHRRRPLPFVTEGAAARRQSLGLASTALAATVPALDGRTALEVAADLLATRAGRSASDVAAWAGSRAAPPILGSLGEGLGRAASNATVTPLSPDGPPIVPLRAPAVSAVLAAAVPAVVAQQQPVDREGRPAGGPTGVGPRTTVGPALLDQVGAVARSAPPRLADVDARLAGAVPARLVRVAAGAAGVPGPGGPGASAGAGTVLPVGAVPPTRSGRSGTEAIAGRGASAATSARLRAASAALSDGIEVRAGEVHVLALPDADRDVDPRYRPRVEVADGVVRVVVVGPGGRVDADAVLAAGGGCEVPAGTRRVVLVGLGGSASALGTAGDPAAPPEVTGWADDVPLPYVGGEAFLADGAVVTAVGRVPRRRAAQVRTGWVAADAVVGGATAVSTRFAGPVDVVAVAMEGGDGDDLAIGLEGARRPTGPDGTPEPPVLVADGPRAVAVFRVLPPDAASGDATEPAGPVVVTVSTGPARRLVGVAGARGTTAVELGTAVADRGFTVVVPDPVPVASGTAVVAWKGL